MFWGNHKVLTPNAHCSYWQEHTDGAEYVPACVCISLKYNQQDATFSRTIYFYKLLHMFPAVPPPIIRSTKLYTHRQILSNQYCCLLLSWMRWNLRCDARTYERQKTCVCNLCSCTYKHVEKSDSEKKTYTAIVVVCILINRNGSQVVEESLVVSQCPRLIKAHFCNSQRFKKCRDNIT
jgi:hypothetical protein